MNLSGWLCVKAIITAACFAVCQAGRGKNGPCRLQTGCGKCCAARWATFAITYFWCIDDAPLQKEGLESAGAEILTDVKGLEAGKCLKCSQQRVRSFVVEQEMPTSVISKVRCQIVYEELGLN